MSTATLADMKSSTAALIAVVALVTFGTGAATAASLVTSQDIKDGTIQPVDLSKAARAGQAKIVHAAASTPTSCTQGCTRYVDINCPAGYHVTGGGMQLDESGDYVWVQSYPLDSTTWRVEALNQNRPSWPYYPDRYAVCSR